MQTLNQGEQATIFKGAVIRNNALYIADDDKITDKDVRINRFVEVEWPTYDSLAHLLPAKSAVTALVRPVSTALWLS
ncbi:hypothetical protein [Klebsiella pneumoniae]|uniref:hypothetical protein n=1 Tax=Klebsiella pneumoniae TaxID=573 RepID=UPI000DF3D5ED|nr:hypothetical protein [Klebsiella pneumoniae]RCR90169.1 hypothetical protein DUW85_01755 [Klebsiella pneumoniae]